MIRNQGVGPTRGLIHGLLRVDPGVIVEGIKGWGIAIGPLSPCSDVGLVPCEGLVLQIEPFNEWDLLDGERLIIREVKEILDASSLSANKLAIWSHELAVTSTYGNLGFSINQKAKKGCVGILLRMSLR